MTEKPILEPAPAVTMALEAMSRGETAGAASIAAQYADPREGAAMFAALVKRIYHERKDVPAMIAAGEAGVRFCLQAVESSANEILATDLKTKARGIAYNTAANCWPGWGDEGIVIQEHDLQSGLALARLSRDLVRDLGLGYKATGTAHWLIGALTLAAGGFADALNEFQRAADAYQAAGEAVHILMVQGYMAMARKADPAFQEAGERELAERVDALREEGSKQAIFFADQIVTAGRILFVS